MTPPVFTILAADSAVTALIGASPVRCFPDTTPQEPPAIPRPYVVWSTTVGTAYNLMDAPPPADHVRVTLAVYADKASDRDAVYEATRAALDPFGYLASLNFSGYDDTTKRYTVSYDWNFIIQHGS